MGPGAGPEPESGGSRATWLRRIASWYGTYVALVALYALAAVAVGLPPDLGASVGSVLGFRIVPDLCAAWLVGRLLVAAFRERTVSGLGTRLRRDLLTRETLERLVGIAVFVIGTVFTYDVYAAFKRGIPLLAQYGWDEAFARLDALAHLGVDPWRITHALPGNAAFTAAMDHLYIWWYGVLIASVLVVATWAPRALRARFFLSLTASNMFAGSLMAIVLASGGPVYYGRFGGDPARFAPLLERLDGTWARQIQEALWHSFESGSNMAYNGISAMPSMHVLIAALIALTAWSWHRVPGAVAALYTAAVLLGSVHLGWHYAIDGYVGLAGAVGFWLLSGRLTRRPAGGPEAQKAGVHMEREGRGSAGPGGGSSPAITTDELSA